MKHLQYNYNGTLRVPLEYHETQAQHHDSIHRSWSSAEGLRFRIEPGPSQAVFSNTQGLVLKCSAVSRTVNSPLNAQSESTKPSSTSSTALSTGSSSNIQIQWLRKTTISSPSKSSSSSNHHQQPTTNVLVHNVSSLLYVRPSDNALVFNSFSSENFRNELHLASYYCMASNHLGSILSREVQVQAIVEIANTVQVNVYDEYVTRGSTASLKCHIISNFKDYLQVNAWILNDGRRVEPIKQNSIDGYELNKLKMFAIYDQLVLVGVNQEDTFRTFKCEIINLITNELITSSTSGKIMLTEPNNTPPSIQSTRSNLNLNAQHGKQILLNCLASGHPQPNFRWFYRSNVVKQLNQMGVHQMTHQLLDYTSDRDQLIELNLAQHWKYQLISRTGILLIKNLTEIDNGGYVCVANNSFGQDQLELKLTVKQKLIVQLNNLSPSTNKQSQQQQQTSSLDSIHLKCNILSGSPIESIKWYYNGLIFNKTLYQETDLLTSSSNLFNSIINKQSLHGSSKHKIIENGQQLIINKFDSTDVGCYQCIVNGGQPTSLSHSSSDLNEMFINQDQYNNNQDNELLTTSGLDSAQDAICFQLSEKAPILKKVFSKTILKQGDKMSLRCIARGNPLPTVQWTVFDTNLPENHRIQYGDYVSLNGDVVSYVNISSVQVADSGLYSCSATNNAGSVSHSDYIHVTGPLSIKQMRNQTVLAGQTVQLVCPVLGYPFEFVRFSKLLKNENTAVAEASTSNLLDEVSIPNFNEEKHRLVPVKSSERIRVLDNGTLIINQVNRELDGGLYRCEAGDSLNLVREKMYLDVISKPTVSQFTFPSHLSQGMRIIITCNVLTGDPPISINWLHTPHNSNTPQLIVFNNVNGKLLSNNNLERSDISEIGSSIVFRQIETSHRGSYTCRASNQAGEDQYTAVMTVKSQPKWIVEPKDKSAIVGETVSFNCQADGYPAPLIRWKMAKDNRAEFKSISSNYHIQTLENGSLTIKEVTKGDQGFYLCESGNGVGTDLAKVIQLQVFVKAHFKLSFDLFRVEKGSPLRLSCAAYGEKPLTIRWQKERVEINPLLEKRYIVTEKETTDGLISELYASSASRDDSFTFTCIAANAYGQAEQHNRVLVEETPDPPSNIEIAEYTHKSITLRYVQPYNGNKAISSYIVQYKKHKDNWTNSLTSEVDGNTLQITIGDLLPLTTYNFRIYAANSYGRSEQSQLISVRTDEQAPTLPPTNIRVEALSAKTIRVKWKQPKHIEQFGSISGYYIGYRVSKSENQQFTFSTVEINNSEDYQINQISNNSQTNNSTMTSNPNNNQHEHILVNLKKATTYTIIVQAFNSKGAGPASSESQCKTKEKDPPSPPQFRITNLNVHSATITWSNVQGGEEVTGYQIFIRGNDFETHEMIKSVLNSTMPTNHTINTLKCGSKYKIYLIAFNEAGESEPSGVQTFQTLGNVPVSPEKRQLIISNSSSTLIKLSAFKAALCPITGFEIKYKLQQDTEWVEISNLEGRFAPSFELIELKPASWYDLIVKAFSEAGSTQVEYSFSTLTATGATIAPQTGAQQPNEEQKLTYKKYIQLMLPVCSALIALIVIIVFLVLFGLKRNQNQHSTNSICDALSTGDHHLSQPSLLHLNSQQQNALQHVAHYTLSHHANQNGQLNGKNDPIINSMLISNGTNNKLIYEANMNQSNNAALHLQNNDSISNSIYCPSIPSPYARTYFFQDNPIVNNPISNCFLMTNELATTNLSQKTLQKANNLNHHDNQNCYDMPMLKDANRNLLIADNSTQINQGTISNEMFN